MPARETERHMVMADKRDECGCHKGCTVLPHSCEKKCQWPNCLTEDEHRQLGEDLAKDHESCPTCDMLVSDCELYGCPRHPDTMKVVDLVRGYHDLYIENQRLRGEV